MFSASSPAPQGEEVTVAIVTVLVNPGKGPPLPHATMAPW